MSIWERKRKGERGDEDEMSGMGQGVCIWVYGKGERGDEIGCWERGVDKGKVLFA